MTGPEKKIENEILNFLKTIGIYCWKNQSTGIFDAQKGVYRKSNNPHHFKGTSDILGIVQGRFLAIEVKSKVGKLTDEQRIFLRNIQDNGGIAFVSRSVAQTAEEILKHFSADERLRQFCREYLASGGHADH